MGPAVRARVGSTVGLVGKEVLVFFDGFAVGSCVGLYVGTLVGLCEGFPTGSCVGLKDGRFDLLKIYCK